MSGKTRKPYASMKPYAKMTFVIVKEIPKIHSHVVKVEVTRANGRKIEPFETVFSDQFLGMALNKSPKHEMKDGKCKCGFEMVWESADSQL